MGFTLGLTGGLAAGKSTVAKWLAEAGFLLVDADRLVADLYRPGKPGAEAVRELFGETYLDSEGGVRHRALAGLVFGDSKARQRLERAIHPMVRERFRAIAEGHSGIVVFEATLLVEAGQADDFDLVVSVEAPAEIRLRRALERGMDETTARSRLLAQGEGEERRAAADLILDSGGSLAELRRQVEALIEDVSRCRARDPGDSPPGPL